MKVMNSRAGPVLELTLSEKLSPRDGSTSCSSGSPSSLHWILVRVSFPCQGCSSTGSNPELNWWLLPPEPVWVAVAKTADVRVVTLGVTLLRMRENVRRSSRLFCGKYAVFAVPSGLGVPPAAAIALSVQQA